MNSTWLHFLSTQHDSFSADNDKRMVALSHLAVLSVNGQDAAGLLQGQITCDVREVNDSTGCLGALCNPKGQVISTFLVLKNQADFLLVLPEELIAVVQARLQRVVLRSKVTLTNSSEHYCLIGINDTAVQIANNLSYTQQDEALKINFFGRQLIIADTAAAMGLWSAYRAAGFQSDSAAHWQYADIAAGMPWLTTTTSEAFIPQQLGLDTLGGISFTKGCYTGQEIVARTHYLGKVKRGLFIATCNTTQTIEIGATVLQADTEQPIGKVLAAQYNGDLWCLQLVLQRADDENYQLKLLKPRLAITLL